MHKLRMYLDTSVFGALYDLEDLLRVEVTKELLELLKSGVKYTPFISNVVIEEIEKAPLNIRTSLIEVIGTTNIDILYETEDCIDLVTEYLRLSDKPSTSPHIRAPFHESQDFSEKIRFFHQKPILAHYLPQYFLIYLTFQHVFR